MYEKVLSGGLYKLQEMNVIRNHLDCSRKEAIDALDIVYAN